MFAGIVNGDDIRVLQAGDYARLALEGCDRLRVDSRCEGGVQSLERDPAFEPEIFGKPHFGHPARSKQALEAVSSIHDVRCTERQMTLREALTRERTAEAALLAGPIAMLALGWRALAEANIALPDGIIRIVAQAALCVFAMHLLARVIVPRARPEILPLVGLLACTGLIFVIRLAPSAADQQANWLAVGTAALGLGMVAGRQPRRMKQLTYTSGLLAVLTLVATGLFGQTINGARLWVSLAGQSVQTTEFIKAFLILFLSGYLADAGGALAVPSGRFAGVSVPGAAYVLPLALVLAGAVAALALLRDLGSIAILLTLAMALLYAATGRLRFALAGFGLVLATGVIGYLAFGHVQARVDAWIHPLADPTGSGYQSLQATYAVNAGGITGVGVGRGMPTVVPAASTDYIYTAVAEELGLAGATGVALVFLVLIHAGMRVAAEAYTTYDRYLAAAIALLMGIQAAVIIGGNLRLIPTTGITLPFVSYGGSSLVVNLGLVGVLLGISHASRRPLA